MPSIDITFVEVSLWNSMHRHQDTKLANINEESGHNIINKYEHTHTKFKQETTKEKAVDREVDFDFETVTNKKISYKNDVTQSSKRNFRRKRLREKQLVAALKAIAFSSYSENNITNAPAARAGVAIDTYTKREVQDDDEDEDFCSLNGIIRNC